MQLLRPGGYLQWAESESKLWKGIHGSPEIGLDEERHGVDEIKRSLKIVDEERSARGLVSYLPNFMVRSLMRLPLERYASAITRDHEPVSIIRFELRPGGASVGSDGELDSMWTNAFSKLTLETMKQLLIAARIRKKAAKEKEGYKAENGYLGQNLVAEIKSLQNYIDNAITHKSVKVKGVFLY